MNTPGVITEHHALVGAHAGTVRLSCVCWWEHDMGDEDDLAELIKTWERHLEDNR